MMLLSKKEIMLVNKEVGEEGIVVNEARLDYAIDLAKKSRNWLRALATLVRTVLIDHVFEDGNKRTAEAIIMAWLEMKDLKWDKDKINKLIVKILRKNIRNIERIAGLIKNAIL